MSANWTLADHVTLFIMAGLFAIFVWWGIS